MRYAGNRRAAIPVSAMALIACAFLVGCFGIPQERSVAAYVNGEPIYEDDVTAYIEGFRSGNNDFETETASGWAEFLKSHGYTSESIRTYVLDTIFIPKTLIRQECASRGIAITDAELDDVIAKEKEDYERANGENSWNSDLSSYGYDEESWRENEHDRLLEEKLHSTVITDVAVSDAQVQAQANATAANYSGKSSYYIRFDSQEAAQSALATLAMTDGTTTLEAFQALGNAVYAGWSSLPASRDAMSKEYTKALNDLNAGNVSNPVQSDSSYLLIFCDAVFSAGAGGESVVLSSIPADIYNQIVSDATEAKGNQLFDDWLEQRKEESSIEYEPMPEGLPYSVSGALTD